MKTSSPVFAAASAALAMSAAKANAQQLNSGRDNAANQAGLSIRPRAVVTIFATQLSTLPRTSATSGIHMETPACSPSSPSTKPPTTTTTTSKGKGQHTVVEIQTTVINGETQLYPVTMLVDDEVAPGETYTSTIVQAGETRVVIGTYGAHSASKSSGATRLLLPPLIAGSALLVAPPVAAIAAIAAMF
ncbi:hypothetical protein GQ54DRAFT_340323 [Martensiomyces pterosporus]|nr:hypothetical protein GQ54DRAFT_340323 [Martensiomyces pterosporus]